MLGHNCKCPGPGAALNLIWLQSQLFDFALKPFFDVNSLSQGAQFLAGGEIAGRFLRFLTALEAAKG